MPPDTSAASVACNGDGDNDKRGSANDAAVYPFDRLYIRFVKNNPLCGICLREWIQLLWKQRHVIAWRWYWPRLFILSFMACMNSIMSIPEWLLWESRIQATEVPARPVFILGHPRTGTTLMHSLLALDAQFFVLTTFCTGFPHSFLWLETFKALFGPLVDKTRPMDQMPLHLDLPNEDELAVNCMTASSLISPYMCLWFMQTERDRRPYFAFDDNATGDEALPPDQMAAARKTWTTAFLYLLKKLTLRWQLRHGKQQPPRLLLKSPVHTARIPLLKQLFPDAQFIYMHRHPYQVFQSTAHMANTTLWYTDMDRPANPQIQEFILRQYEILWEHYQQDKKLLAEGDLVEVSYEELARDPIQTLERVYQQLHWKLSPQFRQKLQADVKERREYRVNAHRTLSPAIRQIIHERWGESFKVLGYEKEE